jgi:hypothetical protein
VRKVNFWMALLLTMLISAGSVSAQEPVTMEYTVVAGDTLDSIAKSYLPSSWGDSHHAFAEFREGIFEYNFERVFVDRKPYEVREGDCLLILFWE